MSRRALDPSNGNRRWLKAELHSHCSLDPIDYRICSHSPEDLIAQAARLDYDVLAITCHDLDIWTRELADYAASLGVVLIPAMEVSTEGGRHTLVYNFRTGRDNLDTLEKIRGRSRPDTLVIAAHPFFPGRICLRELLAPNIGTFDAVEISGFWTRGLDFNRRARAVAGAHGKPLVGNGDVHQLWQLGRTFTWIEATPDVPSILGAIRSGRVRLETSPIGLLDAACWWGTALWRRVFPVNPPPDRRRADLRLGPEDPLPE
jgi:predicted metal-dependent phosphoesterase TrpH